MADYGRYQTGQLQTTAGQAVSGAQVYFLTQPANTNTLTPLADVYDGPNGNLVTQPLLTDGLGQVSAYLAPGVYTVVYISQYTGELIYPDQNIAIGGGSPESGVVLTNPVGDQAIVQPIGTSFSVTSEGGVSGSTSVGGSITLEADAGPSTSGEVLLDADIVNCEGNLLLGDQPTAITSNYTYSPLTGKNLMQVDAASSNITITLPSTIPGPSAAQTIAGLLVMFLRKDSSGSGTNTVTISGASNTFTLTNNNALLLAAKTVSGAIQWVPIGDTATTGTVDFSLLSSGTNTSAAMVVGSGASLAPSGTGSIDATEINGVSVTGTPTSGQIPTATSGTTATWQNPATPTGFVKLSPSGAQAIVQPAGSFFEVVGPTIAFPGSTSTPSVPDEFVVTAANSSSSASIIQFNGGVFLFNGIALDNYVRISSSTTLNSLEGASIFLIDAAPGNITITLPNALNAGGTSIPSDGLSFIFSRYDTAANGNTVTIAATSPATIEGASSVTMQNGTALNFLGTADPTTGVITWIYLADSRIATTAVAGRVKPDGTTITVATDGTITAVGGGGGSNATQLQGVPISATAPTTGQILEYNGTNWIPAAASSGGITQLTGDVTAGPGSGSQAAALSTTGVTAGTYPKVTVDAKGRVSAGAALMPSDLPVATTSALGAVQPDGTTITISSGIISATGGGGSTPTISFLNPNSVSAISSSAFASKGGLFQPQRDVTLYAVWVLLGATAAQTYQAVIGTASALSGSSGVTLTASPTLGSITTIPTLPAINTGSPTTEWIRLPFSSPVSLTAGTDYFIGGCLTSATATTPMPVSAPSVTSMISNPMPFFLGAVGRIAANPPVNGSSIDTNSNGANGQQMALEWT